MVSRSRAAFVFPCSVIFGAMLLPFSSALSLAAVSLPPFYEAAAKIIPDGKLGDTRQAGKQCRLRSPAHRRGASPISLPTSPTAKPWSPALVDRADREGAAGGASDRGLGARHHRGGAELRALPGAQSGATLERVFSAGRQFVDGLRRARGEEFIRSGYVLVATDYQGLGGGGRHQYPWSR